jgi:hypothetical protein
MHVIRIHHLNQPSDTAAKTTAGAAYSRCSSDAEPGQVSVDAAIAPHSSLKISKIS